MSNPYNKNNIPKMEKMDEIDKFLAELPPVETSDDFEDKSHLRPRPSTYVYKPSATSFLILFAWLGNLVSLLVASRAMPSKGNIFYGYLERVYHIYWKTQYLDLATWFLAATLVICVGGFLICLIKKLKMTSFTSLNFMIAGGVAIAIIAICQILRFNLGS